MTDQLSVRQRQVLALLADGLTDLQIGRAIYISGATVKRHVLDIRTKLGARNRAHAVSIGYQRGVLVHSPRNRKVH